MNLSPDHLVQRALRRPEQTLLALDRVECEESLLKFLQAGWRWITNSRFVPGWHLEAIAEHLEAVTSGEITRLVINIPPRMTKSSLVSVAWPAWTWAQSSVGPLSGPHVQFLTTSYGGALSSRDSMRSRRLMQTKWYQDRWGSRFQLTSDQNAKGRYDNDHGGFRLSTSVGGALTGEGGDIIVVDDPHNTIEIESEAQREETLMWWDEALSTRLNDMATGAYVLIMQRLYENDLTGHVLTQDMGEWVHLMLPMEFDSRRKCVTRLGFEDPRVFDGELLSPERIPIEKLPELKKKLGPFGVAGQLQQSPVPRGGAILKEEFWQAWPPHVEEIEELSPLVWDDKAGRMIPVQSTTTYPPMEFILASVDTAMTEKEENDFSAMTVWGMWHDKHGLPQLMLMEAWAERLPLHSLVVKIIGTCNKRKVDRLLIEAKNNGFSAAQEISRLTRGREWSVQLEKVKGDKVARAHACVNVFAAGQVWAPAKNIDGNIVFYAWAQRVMSECALLPRGEHDDLADTVTQAINHFRKTSMLQTADERREDMRRGSLPPAERGEAREPLYGVM